ncbi:transporter [Agitococcus lubricus]|uniref:Outer membrane putative beta-barrel porin/alpha-amylase n=1 Tax=Agitococcus lubricus TaxID=1077255 RepID=A0A2T5J025_9GAMM|nr:transporter [Agitococcus lubricus]PTQ89584.1 outer membrane putative beta-barrel porin/alpha-amylase [Agitococcus lubricus]
MRNWGQTPYVLVALNCLCFSIAHADETTQPANTAASTDTTAAATPAPTPAPSSADVARDALKQKSTDASSDKNLEQVFKAAEKSYSLSKRGKFAMNYDVNYSFYRDSRLDIAISDDTSTITRLRIQEDAQHSFTNNIDVSYGLLDNLTLTGSLPLVYKMDTLAGKETTGLGDISVGLRWQPVPLKRGLPTTTLFSSLSLATGDSPYEINSVTDLSTGKGYYGLSAGLSMSKVTDPIVLFGSASFSIGNKLSDLNQSRGTRNLTSMDPGTSLGASLGFAYSLNYDVSMSASYQHSISTNSRFTFDTGTEIEVVEPATQVSGSLSFSLSLRTSPKRIVNVSLGYGLTEDSPDINLGFSMPLEFLGLATE